MCNEPAHVGLGTSAHHFFAAHNQLPLLRGHLGLAFVGVHDTPRVPRLPRVPSFPVGVVRVSGVGGDAVPVKVWRGVSDEPALATAILGPDP